MSIAYSRYYAELEAVIKEVGKLLTAMNPSEHGLLDRRIVDAHERISSQAPLRLALIGEWNSGKSSLIGALTGADIKIDADVCTDASAEYSWQGLTLLDTPGIQAQGQNATDHDRIAREVTVGADLVLFVMTNELFNPRLAAHLRYILDDIGLGLARKTALIVNKIDRESNAEEMLLVEIQKVLGPHQNIAVHFCSASKLLQAKNVPPELRERFVRQSRISGLTEGIDHFVDDAGTLGRLTTPLQIVAEVVDSLQASVVASDDDKNQLELIRRQKVVLQGLQRQLLELRKTWKQQAISAILGQSESAVEKISEITTGDDLELLFEAGLKQAIAEVEHLYDGVQGAICEALDDAQRKLDEIGESPLARDVANTAPKRAEKVGVDFKSLRPDESEIVAKLGKAATTPLKEGLEAASKNAKGLRDIVYKVGKAFGKKFRPWEPTSIGGKLASVAGKAGKVVPVVAAALDFYLQFREEKVKEEKAKYLASMRMALRNAFSDQAKVEAEALEAGIVAVSQGPVAMALAGLDDRAAAIIEVASEKTVFANEIAALQGRCTRLRTRIMGGVHQQTSEE